MVTIEELQLELKVLVQHREEFNRQYKNSGWKATHLWTSMRMNEYQAKLDYIQNKINQLSMRDWKKYSKRRDSQWRKLN